MSTEELPATEAGPDRRSRWFSALWWSGLVLVPAVVVARLGGHGPAILGLGLVVAAVVFVAFVRHQPTVVTRDEVRTSKRTIRREDVTRVTRSDETTALVFSGDGGVVAIIEVFEQSGKLREALRAHGWPLVDAPA